MPADTANPSELVEALTSGALWPAIGVALVLVSWAVNKLRFGTPIGDQIRHFASTARAPFVAGLTIGGSLLIAGQSWKVALVATVGILFMGANVSKPRDDEPKKGKTGGDFIIAAEGDGRPVRNTGGNIDIRPGTPKGTASSIVFVVMLCCIPMATGGCAGWLAPVLEAVVTAGQYAQIVRAAVDTAERIAKSWFGAHPDEAAEMKLADAIARCRVALDALDASALAAQKTGDGDLTGAREAVGDAYAEVYKLAELGDAMGAAPGSSPGPAAELITPAELEGLL